MAHIAYQNVSKSFGSTEVIRSLDLEVGDGEFVAYVGPSGCGKTTLLRLLSGLETVSAGRILIDGQDVTGRSPKERNLAMVFQNYALYPHMTVAANIGFGLRVRGVASAERDRLVRQAAELLAIDHLLQRKPRELSGGQRQRVAMGRAIVRHPDAFLMDEPLSNLDAQLRSQMRAELRGLQRRLGATMIYVTHDQVEAMTMADRIVVLKDGVVQQVGAPDELYERPANRFVAGFIGAPAMNLAPLQRQGEAAILTGGAALPPALPEAAVELGIRPQHLHLQNGGGRPTVSWQTTVQLVEPMGGETLVHVEAGGATWRLRQEGSAPVKVGEKATIGFDPADAHFFDAAGVAIG